ncbi:hypothetical protein RI543_003031 [Arxiozyma heterogenica]|uniref:Uncharacterized protein n=1 Tax=Arxiozyma heterogenica TaxID=278026 RepID=A0AAN7ZXI8_9SACH|nr:hypothetical protein RI543_003031 [Kazachstania heterogenica]
MNGYKLFGRSIQPHILVISTLLGSNDKDYMDIEQLIDNFLKEHDHKEDKK